MLINNQLEPGFVSFVMIRRESRRELTTLVLRRNQSGKDCPTLRSQATAEAAPTSCPIIIEAYRPSYRPYRPWYRPLYRPLRNLTPNPETVEVVLKWCLEEPILGGSHGL